MHATVVILVVGLTPALVGAHTPNLRRLAAQGGLRPLRDGDAGGHLHGAVDAGDRAAAERAMARSPTAGTSATSPRSGCGASRTGWSRARRSGRPAGGATRTSPAPRCSGGTTCTPRPTGAPRRGRCTRPTAARSRTTTPIRPSCTTSSTRRLGPFPLFKFWGPAADITSSQWIARATHARARHAQADAHALLPAAPRLRPAAPRPRPRPSPPAARTSTRSTRSCGELIEQAERDGARIVVVSEYGITPVARCGPHQPGAARRPG